MQFSDLGLDANLLKAIEESGYTVPTPIQAAAIPHALAGRDVLGIAQTGTGKTAGFTLPMIHLLSKGRARARMPRSLILCPTRELAAQVSENFEKYGKYHRLSMALLIGGVNFGNQDKLIDRGVDVLIATPGRLLDHFERGKLMLTGIQIMVVDEADRMLDMGFIPDIERIFNLTPFTRQTLFFSATMAPEITRLTETFLHNPERVEVAKQATAAATVTQYAISLRPSSREKADQEKRDCLRALIQREGAALTNAIIFCNRKRDVGVVQKSLLSHGFNAGAIHGDLDQSVRTATLNGFREGKIALLVASDVAARGLDIPNVSHVINFDVPTHAEDYVHRIGRTGRAGRSGVSITICLPHEQKYLDKIEEMLGGPIPRAEALGLTTRPADDDSPKGERKPREERRERPAPRERAENKAETRAETKADAPDRPAAPARAGDDRPREDRRERDRDERRGKDDRREDRRVRDDRSRGQRQQGRDAPVVGMGDHVPAFLLREIKPRKDMTSAGVSDETEADMDEGEDRSEVEAA